MQRFGTKLTKSLGARWGRWKRVRNKYAFILCPPYCGSTLLTQILASSQNVSINNSQGTCEGQTLPGVRDHLFVENRWDEHLRIDWPHVKRVWEKYWDVGKPILLEKSPPNLLRASQIAAHFHPVYFFVMWRNPYAHCESQIRRNGNTPREAAGFAVRCLYVQRTNIEQCDDRLPISYEALTADPACFVQRANRFLPDLGKLKITGSFSVHNLLQQDLHISNMNDEKIALLDRDQRREINSVIGKHRPLLDYFGYELLD